MKTSESITNIAKALCEFQGTIEGVKKDSSNPFYKSKYTSLAAIWQAIRPLLKEFGILVVQSVGTSPVLTQDCHFVTNKASYDASVFFISLTTRLIHTSGEFLEDTAIMPTTNIDPQMAGSAITYARRYALAAMLGIHQEDDDANSNKAVVPEPVAPDIDGLIDECQNLFDMKELTSDDKMHYGELFDNAKASKNAFDLEQIAKQLKAKPEKYDDVTRLKKDISAILTKLVDAKYDRYDTQDRRRRSFEKHLDKDTLNECTDIVKLSAYYKHMAEVKKQAGL